MRKHHKRWVALVGAAAIASSGLVGLTGTASADEKDMPTLGWPTVSPGDSSYRLDGYELGYLPAGLERYGVKASSTTDGLGNRQSQLSWMQGPDQLFGQVAVLRSDRFQELDDLRESRYSHLPEEALERLASGETLEQEAYVSAETGDLFWVEEPGVAVSTHLRPDRWDSGELVRMAESVNRISAEEKPVEEGSAEERPAEEESTEATGSAEEEPGEPTVEESAAEGPTVEGPQTPQSHEAPGSSEAPAERDVDASPAEDTAEGSVEEVAENEASTEAGPPKDTRSRQVKECVIDRLMDFETGGSGLGEAGLSLSSREFVEQVLAKEELTDDERDRLLATVWYYGDESGKTGAVDGCARELGLTSDEVEKVVFELAELIAELAQETDQQAAEGMDNVSPALGKTASALPVEPIGAEEWEKLRQSLPWSFPSGTG